MKYFLFIFLVASLLLVSNNTTSAQYKIGKNTGTLSVGFGGGGLTGTGAVPISAEFNFLNYEKNINAGVFIAYSSTSEDFFYGHWKYTYFILAAQGNWHFLPGDKLDPFAGISLGYNIASFTSTYNDGFSSLNYNYSPSIGGFFISAQAGLNYWFEERYAVQVRVGYFPYASIGFTMGF